MTPKNFNQAMAKGAVGERIIKAKLEKAGFIVYRPETDGAHAFDVLAIKNKERCIAMDVKAKARRNRYADTGINDAHFRVYQKFSEMHAMPFWVIFVDEGQGTIYGNTLEKLERAVTIQGKQYPSVERVGSVEIRFWPLTNMEQMHALTAHERAELETYNQRSYTFTPTT